MRGVRKPSGGVAVRVRMVHARRPGTPHGGPISLRVDTRFRQGYGPSAVRCRRMWRRVLARSGHASFAFGGHCRHCRQSDRGRLHEHRAERIVGTRERYPDHFGWVEYRRGEDDKVGVVRPVGHRRCRDYERELVQSLSTRPRNRHYHGQLREQRAFAADRSDADGGCAAYAGYQPRRTEQRTGPDFDARSCGGSVASASDHPACSSRRRQSVQPACSEVEPAGQR